MRARAWRWLGALALVAAVGLGVRWAWRALDPLAGGDDAAPAPTDDELRELVRAHAAALDELRAMITAEPKLGIIGDDRVGECWRGRDGAWGCPDAKGLDERGLLAHVGLARERWARYRELLSSVGGHRVERLSGGRVQVTIWGAGIVTSGATKDLVWSPSPPSPLVADTDRERPTRYTVNYAAAPGGWYIEHTSN